MSMPYRSPHLSKPSERLAHFAQRASRGVAFDALPALASRWAEGLGIDPCSRQAGFEDAQAGRPPSPTYYDDLGYFAGYASGKGWRR